MTSVRPDSYWRVLLLSVAALSGSLAHAEEASRAAGFSEQESLTSLLSRGELTLVESKPGKKSGQDGGLKQVTSIANIKAPVEAVWAKLIDFPAYTVWMPKVTECTPTRTEGNQVDVQWNIDVPGPNYRYLTRNVLDKAHFRIEQSQLEGALKGSHWSWQLIAQGDSTLVYRTAFTNVTDESWLARQLDDESHTLSYGINVSTGLLEVRALRRVMEHRP